MKNEVVTFEQALQLCELGFNEVTCCGYLIENRELYLCSLEDEEFYKPEKDLHAPLKQQVFRWFRDNYNLHPLIRPGRHYEKGSVFDFDIFVGYENRIKLDNYWESYEQAENAAIDKLIELAKQL